MSCKFTDFFRLACDEFTEKRLKHREYNTTSAYIGWPKTEYKHPKDCDDYMELWGKTLKMYWQLIDRELDEPKASPGTRL
jgi:hypothetical protein